MGETDGLLQRAPDPRAVPDRPRRSSRGGQLRHRPVGHDRERDVWRRGHWRQLLTVDCRFREPHHDLRRHSVRISVEGRYHTARHRDVLLSRLSRHHRSTGRQRVARVHNPGAVRLDRVLLIRRLWRLGAGRRQRSERRPGEPDGPDRRKRSALRGLSRRQRLPQRQPDQLWRSAAVRSRHERHLRLAVLDLAKRLHPTVRGCGQPRPKRSEAHRYHDVDPGHSSLVFRWSLPERCLLLHQRDVLIELWQRVVCVLGRQRALLHARLRLGRHERGHRVAVRE